MALAYLTPNPETDPSRYEFLADLGTNEFFDYSIGSREPGGEGLGAVTYTSPLQRRGPSRGPFNSQFAFRVPPGLFSHSARDLQLRSYRDAMRRGPAVSRVVSVVPGLRPGEDGAGPEPAAGMFSAMNSTLNQPGFNRCRSRGFSFEESPLSHGMFLEELLKLAGTLAPAVLNALPGILGGAVGAGGPTGRGPGATAPPADAASAIVRLIGAIISALPPQSMPGPATAPPAAAAGTRPGEVLSHPTSVRWGGRLAHFSNGTPPTAAVSRQQFIDGGVITIPALIALLGAAAPIISTVAGPLLNSVVGPLAQQAPQLLQNLADRPTEFIESLKRMGIQRAQNDQNFMAGLLAEVNRSQEAQEVLRRIGETGPPAPTPPAPAGTQGTAGGLSLAARARPIAAATRVMSTVALVFDPGPTLQVEEKPKSVYTPDHGLTLTATLTFNGTPPTRPLPRALLDLSITDTESLTPALTKQFRLQNLGPATPVRLTLSPEELRRLPRHRDLHITASVRWPTPAGTVAALGQHLIYLTDGPLFRSLGADGREVALRDAVRYRPFWNKIWESPDPAATGALRWELDAVCRYYLRADFEHDSNARVETRIQERPQEFESNARRIAGRMKSGMELSLDELNKLLPLVAGQAPLTGEQLDAVKCSEARGRFDLEATTRLSAKGPRSTVGAVWVFPEVRLCELVLGEIDGVNANGQATGVRDRRLLFPVPSSVHFVTIRST